MSKTVSLKYLFVTLAALLVATTTWAQSTQPGMGAIPYAGGTTFRVWAPNASSVGVKGSFSGWSTLNLTSEGNGHWSADIAGAGHGQEYRYVITQNGWTFDRADARSRRVTHSNGNSIIYDHSVYNWQGDNFSTPWHNDLVIYEMHVGSFQARPNGWTPGKFSDAISRLDHLQAMGINAVELMPVNEFYGDHSWGYNPADLYAIETAFGGPDGLKNFVRECHARGIAVLMDVVHNHYGPSDLGLWQYDGWNEGGHGGIYFYQDDRRYTPWGETRPDYGRVEVQSFIRDQIRMWVEDYHIDGFRWDAVYHMTHTGFTDNPQGAWLISDINAMIHNDYPGVISIAEDDAFGRGFDSQWDVPWFYDLKFQITTGDDSQRSIPYIAGFVNNGANHGRVIYTESHDTCAEENGKQRLISDIDSGDPASIWARKRSLLGTALCLTSVGIPMLFQGQEFLEHVAFKAQEALHWDRATTYSGIVQAYSDLIWLRRNLTGDTRGLKGTGSNVYHQDDVNKIMAFHRWDQGGVGDDVVVVMNWGATVWSGGSYSIDFPYAGTWYTLFNSDATQYSADFGNVGPTQVNAAGPNNSAPVDIGMYSVLIFGRSKNLSPPPGLVSVSPTTPIGCEPMTISYEPNGSALDGVDPIYLQLGHDGWQDPISPVMTESNGVWSYVYTPTTGVGQLDFVFFDGTNVFDNNRGLDWSADYVDCEDIPSEVTYLPVGPPVGCDPVTIQYRANEGPLMTATQVVMFAGRNGWIGSTDQIMTQSGSVWQATIVPAPDTDVLNLVFHDGDTNGVTRTWDNNQGQDWSLVLPDCAQPMSIRIVSPTDSTTVPFSNDSLIVEGTASSNVMVDLQVQNLSANYTALVAPADDWILTNVPFVVGLNKVVAYADATPGVTQSFDQAEDAVYTGGWSEGLNGGFGFSRGWVLTAGPNAGQFTADNLTHASTMTIGTNAWGLWANSDSSSDAYRDLNRILGVGATVHIDFENGFIDSDKSVGFALKNDANASLAEFYFVGGQPTYRIRDAAGEQITSLGWTNGALHLAFTLLAPDTFLLEVGGVSHTGALIAAGDLQVSKVHAWNFSAGGGDDSNLYVNNLSVDGPQWDAMDCVNVFRLPESGFIDLDGDGLPDSWEQALIDALPGDGINTINDVMVTDDFDGDGRNNLDEYIAGTDATDGDDYLEVRIQLGTTSAELEFDSESGRHYNLWYADSLVPSPTWIWANAGGGELIGDGNPKSWPDVPTPTVPMRAYRVEAILPAP